MKFTIGFTFDKETPGTVRYKELNEKGKVADKDEIVVGFLYIQKRAFSLPSGKYPQSLSVTVEMHE